MSYYAAGAWWTASGQSFPSQAEADAYEKSQAATSGAAAGGAAAAGAVRSNAFAAATGRAAPTATGSRGSAQTPVPAASGRGQQAPAQPAAAPSQQGAYSNLTEEQRQAALATRGNQGFYTDPLGKGLSTAADLYRNPVTNPIGYGATQGGRAINQLTGVDVSGYIQDPLGQALNDVGAPDLVQAIANPTGFATRTAVNANTGYGTNPAAAIQGGIQAGRNILNDGRNTANAVQQVPGAIADAARAAGGFVNGIVNAAGSQRGVGTGGTAVQQQPLPQLSMTPQSILGMNTDAARPSSAQQDSIVNQMMAQANQTSAYQDFNSPQYNETRGAAMGYTSQLAGLANNNVADIQANSAQRDQSRNAVMDTASQLNANADREIRDILANRDASIESRQRALQAQSALTGNAYQDVASNYADQGDFRGTMSDVEGTERMLRGNSLNNIGPIAADTGRLDGSTATSNDIIQRLLAASELPDDQSAAQALMLNAQERAVRNAYGDASSLSGGWRSQLTGQRRAMGQAASMQADIAAQMGALRAQETQQNRQRQLEALGLAGGFAGDISARDLALAQGDQNIAAQLGIANQTNARDSLLGAGQLGLGRGELQGQMATSDANRNTLIAQGNQQNRLASLTNSGTLAAQIQGLDQNMEISDADRLAVIAQANQNNRLNSLMGSGQLQTGAMNSDTNLAQTNAALLAQIRQGNQANSLNAMLGATSAANQTASMDANIGMNNANNRITVDQNNRANSIAALQNAGVLSSATRGQDVQLSVANQQALTSRINSAAGLAGSQFATQMNAALTQTDQALRQQQFEFMKTQAPREYERWLAAAGSTAGLLGVLL